MTFDGVFGSLAQVQAMTQQAISAGNASNIWNLEPDGTLDYQGTPLPNTAISGLHGTAQNHENAMTTAWNKVLKEPDDQINQSVKDMIAAQQAATKLNNQLNAQIQANKAQLATTTNATKISQLQTELTQLLQDQKNLLNEQELLSQIEATKLVAAAQKLQAGPTGAGPTGAGPTGTGPTGTGPTGAGPTGAGPTGAGPTGPPVYTVGAGPTGTVTTAGSNPNGTSNGTGSSMPMMMPMPMPMGGGGMGSGSPMSGMNDLASQSGATGPQGSNVLADQITGPTGATAQDVSATSKTDAGGTGPKPPGASAPTMAASTNTVPTSAGTVPASSLRSVGNSVPAGSNTDVKPDGTTTPASNMQAATAGRAAQSGATSADAGQQAGMALPPLGALNRKSDRAGKHGDQRRPGAERPSGDHDQDSDHSRRQ
jgi:hypothetical protein